MTPAEIIKKQAEAVTGFNKLTAAAHLEAAAKLLKQEAGQEAKKSLAEFHAIVKDRKTKRINGMNASFVKIKQEKITRAFAGSDWMHASAFSTTSETVYTKKGISGLRLTIKGDNFSVTAAGKVICEPLSIEHLEAWIQKEKKGG